MLEKLYVGKGLSLSMRPCRRILIGKVALATLLLLNVPAELKALTEELGLGLNCISIQSALDPRLLHSVDN